VESGTIREPWGGLDRGGLNGQRGQASKHIIAERGDAEARIFPPNDGNQYYALPSAGSAHTRVTEQAVE